MSVKVNLNVPQISEHWIGIFDFPEAPEIGDEIDLISLADVAGKERSAVTLKIIEKEFKAIAEVESKTWKKDGEGTIYLSVNLKLDKQNP